MSDWLVQNQVFHRILLNNIFTWISPRVRVSKQDQREKEMNYFFFLLQLTNNWLSMFLLFSWLSLTFLTWASSTGCQWDLTNIPSWRLPVKWKGPPNTILDSPLLSQNKIMSIRRCKIWGQLTSSVTICLCRKCSLNLNGFFVWCLLDFCVLNF